MRRINLWAVALATVAGALPPAMAGPYSSGLSNITPNAIDPAVPGFVGPAGVGVTDPSNVVNPAFVGWATAVQSYLPAPGVDPEWSDPSLALGPVTGDNFDVVSLGDLSASQIASGTPPGQITLQFSGGIRNGPGADFAVFENSFGTQNSVFADLAYVEVSTDGQHFARFPSISLTPNAVGPFGQIDPTNVHDLAGKHVNAFGNSFGTPFDLSELSNDPEVTSKQVNLHDIQYVRFVDIPGNGSFTDSAGNPIYDAWQTVGSGGFDLEAVGVLNSWLPGDANFDGVVDARDLGILAANWQQSGRDFSQGDFNQDGVVNIDDLYLLATHWQTNEASLSAALAALGLPAQSIPEPVGLLTFAAFFVSARTRRMK